MSQPNNSSNSTHPSLPPKPPVSLPARPPVVPGVGGVGTGGVSRPGPNSNGHNSGNAARSGGFGASFGTVPSHAPAVNTAFKPRSVASHSGWKAPGMAGAKPHPGVMPQTGLTGYHHTPAIQTQPTQTSYGHPHPTNPYYNQMQHQQSHQQQLHPQQAYRQMQPFANGILNPNQAPYQHPAYPQQYGQTQTQMQPQGSHVSDYDAQIAQWQSAYYGAGAGDVSDPTGSAAMAQGQYLGGPMAGQTPGLNDGTSPAPLQPPVQQPEEEMYVVRSGGGKTWTDPKLLEWDPSHFRLFVGNLAGDVTDEALHKSFSKYLSLSKARVVRAKQNNKSRGYGFVSFSDSDDYFRAFKEMQGKYIGGHPVKIDKANSNITPVVKKPNGNHHGGNHKGKGGNRANFQNRQNQAPSQPANPNLGQQVPMAGHVQMHAPQPQMQQYPHQQQQYQVQPTGFDPSMQQRPGASGGGGGGRGGGGAGGGSSSNNNNNNNNNSNVFRHTPPNSQNQKKQNRPSDALGPKKNSGVSKKKQDKNKTRDGLKILG